MAVNHLPDKRISPDIATMSPKEILERGLVTERLEVVPLKSVLTEKALVDPFHAQELGASMKKRRGQISPIVTRARLDGGDVVYDVIDGFHRTTGRKQNGDPDIKSNVLYGCDDDEMTDLRILAASSVKSVQFPRVAQWITDSWGSTEWAKKGLTVVNGFSMAVSNSQRSNLVDVSPQEVNAMKDWINDKCDRWQKGVTSVYQILRVVANADPDLVSQVRTSGGGKDRNGRITPARLGAVVDAFPGEECHAIQRGILKIVVDNRFTAAETNQLVEELKSQVKPGMQEAEIYELAADAILNKTDTPTTKPVERAKRGQIQQAVEEAFATELEVGLADDEFTEPSPADLAEIDGLLKQEGLSAEKPATGIKLDKARAARSYGVLASSDKPDIAPVINAKALAEGDTENVADLKARVADLTLALEAASQGQESSDSWWRTATWLSPVERLCMEQLMGQNKHPQEVVEELQKTGERRITRLNVLGFVQSAYVKRRLAVEKQK